MQTRRRLDPAEYRGRIEERYLHITQETKIRRVVLLEILGGKLTPKHQLGRSDYYYVNKDQIRGTLRTFSGWSSIVFKRKYWVVVGGDGSETRWNRLEMAQAQRDGYNYHWARHLLAKGTKAEDHA